MGSLWKMSRRTSGENWALWRNVLIAMARHHPAEPSARATSSITWSAVRMSAPRPPAASDTATLNRPAPAISATRSGGGWRVASISSPRARIRGARARATSSGEGAAAVSTVTRAPPPRSDRDQPAADLATGDEMRGGLAVREEVGRGAVELDGLLV